MEPTKYNELTGNFIILSADETHIALPLEDVGQANYLSHDTEWLVQPNMPGCFASNEYPDKLFIALSDQLKPIATKLDDRFIILPFAHTDDNIMWVWKTAKLLNNHTFNVFALPSFVISENSPISSYTYHEDKMVYLCRVQHLVNFALQEVA